MLGAKIVTFLLGQAVFCAGATSRVNYPDLFGPVTGENTSNPIISSLLQLIKNKFFVVTVPRICSIISRIRLYVPDHRTITWRKRTFYSFEVKASNGINLIMSRDSCLTFAIFWKNQKKKLRYGFQ